MNVFVAGATGAIGRPLVRELMSAGHEVSAITRSEGRADHLQREGVKAYVGDALDRARLIEIVRAVEPEVMIHQLTTFPTTMRPLRGFREWRQTVRLRIHGTRLFVDLAKRFGVRRVVAQSIAFGYKPFIDEREAREGDPYYGKGRRVIDRFMSHLLRLEETVVGAAGVEGVALRYGGWYGPGTHFARGGLMHRLAMKRRLPTFRGREGVWNSIQVDDAATATVAALSGPPGVFNVVDDAAMPWRRFVATYCDAIGAPPPRVLPRWTGLFLGFYGRHLVFHQVPVSNERAKNELDWHPRYSTFEDGVATLLP